MAKRTDGFAAARRLGLALPGVEEGTTYGAWALMVRGRMFACRAIHRSAEPGSLAVRIDFDRRDELIAADPDVYYVTDHYVNYPAMLVRTSRISEDALGDLLRMAHAFVSAKSKVRPRKRRARAPS